MENVHNTKVIKERPKGEKLDTLAKAFEMFSQESLRLEGAYNSLNQHFQVLNVELQEANGKLQKKVEELDNITQYLKNILDNISQGILFIDFQGFITTYNDAAKRILQIPSQEILHKSFWDRFDDSTFGFSMREVLHTKRAPTFSTISYNNPQSHCDLEISTSFADGLILMIRDITEIRQLQMIANRADRLKELGEMAAQVAHEIRNPLGGIKGFASLLERDLAQNPELQQMATYIVEGTDNLNILVNQVLQYARPLQPHLEVVDIVPWLEELRHHIMADPMLQARRIWIDFHTLEQHVPVLIDTVLFQSAMLNLIFNAVQATPKDNKVTITIEKNPQNILVSISDKGIGIPPEHHNKLFSPFFTTKSEGTGLGLAEVQKVVQAHGGTIEFTSQVAQGTSFTIALPNKQRQPYDH